MEKHKIEIVDCWIVSLNKLSVNNLLKVFTEKGSYGEIFTHTHRNYSSIVKGFLFFKDTEFSFYS